MQEPQSDELLSAYLDGELTADEQAHVERLLAADPQARRQFEELRLLRGALQTLPRLSPPADIATRAMREAQRRMLSQPQETPEDTGTTAQRETEDPALDPPLRERWRRPLAYVLLVLAASLLIVFFNAPHEGLAPVAHAPPGEVRRAEDRAEETPQPLNKLRGTGEAGKSAGTRFGKTPDSHAKGDYEGTAAVPASEAAAINAPAYSDAPGASSTLSTAAAAGDLLVVTCEITPAAARENKFLEVLAKNYIAVDEGSVQRGASQATDQLAAEGQNRRKAGPSDLEVYYIEATPSQLEATLADISGKRDEFVSVEVGAPQSSLTQPWTQQYNRGPGGLNQYRYLAPQNLALQPQAAEPAQVGQRLTQHTAPAEKQAAPPAVPADPAPTARPSTAVQKTAESATANEKSAQGGFAAGRARSYAVPSQLADSAEQQTPRPAPAPQQPRQMAKDGVPPANAAQAPVVQENSTMRALFVLRVADEAETKTEAGQPPAAESKPR